MALFYKAVDKVALSFCFVEDSIVSVLFGQCYDCVNVTAMCLQCICFIINSCLHMCICFSHLKLGSQNNVSHHSLSLKPQTQGVMDSMVALKIRYLYIIEYLIYTGYQYYLIIIFISKLRIHSYQIAT